MIHRYYSMVAIGLLVMAAIYPVSAQDLVSVEVNPRDFGISTALENADGLQFRYVRINSSALGATLRLNLFTEADFDAVQDRSERQHQSTVWIGHIPGSINSSVIITQHDDGTLFGKIEADGHVYQIRPRGRGIHAVVDVNVSGLDEGSDDGVLHDDGAGKMGAVQSVCDFSDTCPAQTIDIMVVYTAQARSVLGGSDAAAQAAIATAVSEMNTANVNAGVIHSYNLVHTALVDYVESGDAGTDLSRLYGTSDGYMDIVHTWRNTYYADLVALISATGGCGIGYVQGSGNYSSNAAFNVTRYDCLTGNKTLAHESGHNMGLHHDWYVNSSTTPCLWHHGYVNQNAFGGTSGQRWRTIMAYGDQCYDSGFNCTRLTSWSNPNVTYNGDPMGIDRNASSTPADGAYGLNRAGCQVSQFRVAPNPSEYIVLSPNGGETWTQGEQRTISWSSTIADAVDIDLLHNSSVTNLATGVPNNGSFSWTISGDQTPDCNYTVRVSSTLSSSLNDESNGAFCIQTPPATDMWVDHVIVDQEQSGRNRYRGTATVFVIDEMQNPVSGATVTGDFSGDLNESGKSGTTGSDGSVTINTSGKQKGGILVDFCISSVTHGTLTYVPENNGSSATVCGDGGGGGGGGGGGNPTHVLVSDLSTGTQGAGRGQKYGKATVTIQDNVGNPIAGVTVSGNFSGDLGASTGSGTTDGNGVATILTSNTGNGKINVSFCVSSIANPPLPYDPNQNASSSYACSANAAAKAGPMAVTLEPNYPNPFNPSTMISYALPEAGPVTLKVFDLLGKEMATLADGFREVGQHQVRFDAGELSAGTYLIVIQAGTFTQTRHMTLLK